MATLAGGALTVYLLTAMVGRRLTLSVGAAVVIVAAAVLVFVVGRPWWRTAAAARAVKVAEAHLGAAKRAHYPARSGSSRRPDYAAAIDQYRLAIQTDPRPTEAHLGLISATRSSEFARSFASGTGASDARGRLNAFDAAGRASLLEFYDGIEASHPGEPTTEWALGRLFPDDPARAQAHYRRAVERDPGFAPAWADLARLATLVDDRPRALEFYRKAAAADPSSAEFAYQAAIHIDVDDRGAFDRAADDILTRFPGTSYAAFILGAAANRALSANDALRILERQHRDYPDPGRALSLFRAYLDVDADRAMTFAHSVVAGSSQSWVPSMWKPYQSCGAALLEARRLAGAQDYARARALLDKTTATWPCSITPLHLQRARIDVADGGAARAVDRLIDVVAIRRTPALEAALYEYAHQAGRSDGWIEDAIWRRRTSTARPAEDLGLARLDGSGVVRLRELRGRVVLLNFWYPG